MADEEKQATLRDTIMESIATHSDSNTETATPAPDVVVAPSTPETQEPAKPGRTAGRARDEHGKLLPGKADKTDKPQIAAPEQPKPAEPTTAIEVKPAAPAAASIPRPSSWKKEMWPIWDKLVAGETLTGDEAKQVAQYNAQRESQFASGVSTYRQIAESAKPLMDAITPFQADLDKYGVQAPQLVHSLMSAHKSLALGSPHEKLQIFNKLANDYGIPLQALYDQNAQQQFLAQPHYRQPEQPQQQPQDIAALIERTLADREVKQTISSMQSNKEKYPFFEYVRGTMAQLLDSNAATDLEDAYEQALAAPEHALLSTVMQSQHAQQQEAQRIAAAQATVRAARANTISPKSATPASVANADVGKKGVRAALRDAMDQHAGNARV